MYDWTIMGLSTALNLGYMGIAWNSSDSTVAGWYQYTAGYPKCSNAGHPSGCTYWTDWYAGGCQIGSFFNYDSGCGVGGACANANRNYKFGCAASPGDSGGSLFSYSPGSSGPYIVGEAEFEDCSGSSCTGNATPNTAVRIDQGLFNYMLSLKAVYP